MTAVPILEARGLTIRFGDHAAVSDVSFALHPGRTTALVGESGSGKSLTSLALMGLLRRFTRARVEGAVDYLDESGQTIDLVAATERTMRRLRGNEIAMIFQEPLSCLNPLMRVADQIAEGLVLHEDLRPAAARSRAVELMERVRIPGAARRGRQFPHQLSGGMRQRVMIAMALACRPRVLIADEPTTALDVTVQAQVLHLINELKEELGMAVLFITHDMGVVAEVADDVLVMRNSHVVESGSALEVFENPTADYTRRLLSAVPVLGQMQGHSGPRKFVLEGEVR